MHMNEETLGKPSVSTHAASSFYGLYPWGSGLFSIMLLGTRLHQRSSVFGLDVSLGLRLVQPNRDIRL